MYTINENMKIKNLSKFASIYEDSIRFKEEIPDIRPSYFRDIDRIIYSLSFSRYMDKTQVFSLKNNDHLSKRMTHVQYVSKIARTIGRALNLNEDLIEAAALGHDLGHTPFGHSGESILNELSLKHNQGYFNHNIQSVRLLMNIENYGNGLNVSLQVMDAIMCHNGEFSLQKLVMTNKTKEEFLNEYNNSYKDKNIIKKLRPMTLEGCVVRISDLIAYLGRDIEDAVRLNVITHEDIPKNIRDVLGYNNKEIVNNIIMDIINNSYNKPYIKLSDNIYKAIVDLKKFNYNYIYIKSLSDKDRVILKNMFNVLFEYYLNDLKTNTNKSSLYVNYLTKMNDEYKKNSYERIVIDYLAGMTDNFFINEYKKINSLNKLRYNIKDNKKG